MNSSNLVNIGVLVLLVVVTIVLLLSYLLVWRNGYINGFRAARTGAPICPNCGYDMTGLTECRCPECGRSFELDKLWQTPPRKMPKAAALR